MIRIEGNKAIITGVGNVPVFDVEAAEKQAQLWPSDVHEINYARAICKLPDIGPAKISDDDNLLEREYLAPMYDAFADGLSRLPWAARLLEAGKLAQDPAFVERARVEKVDALLSPLWQSVEQLAETALQKSEKALAHAEILVRGITLPEAGGDLVLLHLKAVEVRGLFAATPIEKRNRLLMEIAGAGDMDALSALVDAPAWMTGMADSDRRTARHLATETVAPWALQQLALARHIHRMGGNRLDQTRAAIHLGMREFRKQLHLPNPGLSSADHVKLVTLAGRRVEASKELAIA